MLSRKALLLLFLSTVAGFADPLTAFYFTSSIGSQIAPGETELLTPSDDYTFSVSQLIENFAGGINSVQVEVKEYRPFHFWQMAFASGNDQPVTVGDYTGANRWPYEDPSIPGLSFQGDGRGDLKLTGYFSIVQIGANGGQVTSFAADFMQFDNGLPGAWNYGSIRYNSDVPLDFTTVPEPVTATLFAAALTALAIAKRFRPRPLQVEHVNGKRAASVR